MNGRTVLQTLILFFMAFVATSAAAWLEGEASRERAMDLQPDVVNGLEVYRHCADCHLPQGWGQVDGSFPVIAGQHRNVLIKQLTDRRLGNRDNPAMYPFSLQEEVGGEQAIADVTAYISELLMNPEPGFGPGTHLEQGKQTYNANCAWCHGINGEGDNQRFYPRIHGQHYEYLSRQMRWIRDGKRRNSNPEMTSQIKRLSEQNLEAVADYVSRLKPPPELLATPDWANPDFE